MFFASDDEDCKTAGDHDAQGHVGGPVEIEDSDQDGQEDDEDSSVDAMDLPKWPNHMELGVSCLEPWHCPKTVGHTRNNKDSVNISLLQRWKKIRPWLDLLCFRHAASFPGL